MDARFLSNIFDQHVDFRSPEHGDLIGIDTAIALMQSGLHPALKKGWKRYLKARRRLEKAGLTGSKLRQEALLEAMRADGFAVETIVMQIQEH